MMQESQDEPLAWPERLHGAPELVPLLPIMAVSNGTGAMNG